MHKNLPSLSVKCVRPDILYFVKAAGEFSKFWNIQSLCASSSEHVRLCVIFLKSPYGNLDRIWSACTITFLNRQYYTIHDTYNQNLWKTLLKFMIFFKYDVNMIYQWLSLCVVAWDEEVWRSGVSGEDLQHTRISSMCNKLDACVSKHIYTLRPFHCLNDLDALGTD